MADIELSTVYDAMKAAGEFPHTIEGMRAALGAVFRHPGGEMVTVTMVDVGLGAWRNSRACAGNHEDAMRAALAAVTDLITPKPTRAEVPFREVHQAVAAYVAEGHSDGVYENDHQLTAAMRERLRVDFTSTGPAGALGHYNGRAQDRFYRQVKTALDKLADAGVLRKAGAGSTGPDGRPVDRTQVKYYTPEAWQAAGRQAAERKTAESALEDSWRRVCIRLGGLGFPMPVRASAPLLEPGEWERLLSLAEVGVEYSRERAAGA